MITIKELQDAEAGQKIGGFKKTIKKTKKLWQVGKHWIHQVVLMDETGEMLADVKVGGYNPLIRNTEIIIVTAETRDADVGRILYVDEFRFELVNEPPGIPNFTGDDRVVRSKIKCWLVAATLQSGETVDKPRILKLVDFIME